MNLAVTHKVKAYLKQHAEEIYPNECCGFLYGQDGDFRKVELAIKVENSKEGDRKKRFEISPTDYMKAEKFALENDTNLLGIYHSHPDHPAVPSRHDFIQAVPYFSYVILSVRNGNLQKTTSWQLDDDGRFKREKIIDENKFELVIK